MVLRGLLPSLPMKKTVYLNLDILVLFSIALGLSGGPLQLQMGDASLQGGNMVGQIRKTYHLMIYTGLLPYSTMKKTAKADMVVLMIFFVALGL